MMTSEIKTVKPGFLPAFDGFQVALGLDLLLDAARVTNIFGLAFTFNLLHSRQPNASDRRTKNLHTIFDATLYKKLAKQKWPTRKTRVTFSFNAKHKFLQNITFNAHKTCSHSSIQSSRVFISKKIHF